MRVFRLPENFTLDFKENLLLAYAFINNKELYEPECSFQNKNSVKQPKEDYVFGDDAFISYGLKFGMPSWYDFCKAHKDDENLGFLCVAGCDEHDETRITMSYVPKDAMDAVGQTGLVFSISESIGKKKTQYFVDSIIALYDQFKETYL